jgi:hypothetical protein
VSVKRFEFLDSKELIPVGRAGQLGLTEAATSSGLQSPTPPPVRPRSGTRTCPAPASSLRAMSPRSCARWRSCTRRSRGSCPRSTHLRTGRHSCTGFLLIGDRTGITDGWHTVGSNAMRWYGIDSTGHRKDGIPGRHVLRCLPEMVAAEAVLHAALELAGVRAAVGTGLGADAVALAAGPLAGVAVAAVEPVHAVAVALALPVLAAVPAAARPALDAVPVVLAVRPVPLVLALPEEAVHAAAAAAAPAELPLVPVPVAVELDALPHLRADVVPLLLLLAVALADEPLHGGQAARPGAAEPRDGGGGGGSGREREPRRGRQEGQVPAAVAPAQEQRGEREGREEEEEEQGLGWAWAEPVVGPAEQRPGRRLRLLVVGLRVVEDGVEGRGAGARADGRRTEQRRRRPRQLTGPAAVPVHASTPSRPRRRVSSSPALLCFLPANRQFLGARAFSLSLSLVELPPRLDGSIGAEGVVGEWKRKKRGSGPERRLL